MANPFGDPQTAALLGLAQGLLAAGSPQPFPTSLGGALSQGIGGALSGAYGAQRYNLAEQQAQALQYANRRAKFQSDLLDQLSGGNQNALGTGISAASGGTGINPSAYGAAGLNPSQQSAPSPQGASSAGGYFNPQQLFQQGYMFNLAGLPGGAGMMETAINHDPSITGPVALAAKGYVPLPGGGYGLAPGFAEGQGAIAGAEAGAKFPFQATESLLRYAGRPVAVGPGQKVVSGLSMLPQQFQNVVGNALAGRPGVTTPQKEMPISPSGKLPEIEGIKPFDKASQEERGRVLEEQYKGWASQADQAKTDNLTIDQMRRESQSWSPGPAAEQWQGIKAYLTRLPGVSEDFKKEVGDYQAFSKNAINLSATAARAMGAREPGSVIQMFKNAYPNAGLTSNALDAMFTQIQGVNDYKQTLQQAADAWRQDPRNKTPGTLDGFQAQWNKVMDPQFFLLRRMSPEVRQQFYASMKPAERAQFATKYKSALESGFLPPL